MTAECIRSAALDGRHHLQLSQAQMATMIGSVPITMLVEYVCHLHQGWPRHLRSGYVLYGLQGTDHFTQRAVRYMRVASCGGQFTMAQQHLYHADVDLLFE